MASSPGIALQALRAEVQTRLGWASGPENARGTDLVDSFIRSAHQQLYAEMPWLALRQEVEIPLIEDQAVYDIPNGMALGKMLGARVVTTEGKSYDLGIGITSIERNSIDSEDASGQPTLLDYVDGDLTLYPAPDDQWATLIFRFTAAPSALSDPEDMIVIDREACLLKALILAKEHFGMPGTQGLRGDFENYLRRVRANESDGAGLQLGGHQTKSTTPQARNRLGNGGRNNVYSSGWNPW